MRKALVCIMLAAGLPCVAQNKGGDAGKGQAVFQEQCTGCHGDDGRAKTDMGQSLKAADLTSAAVQGQNDSQLEKVIRDGKDKMPAFNDKLSSDDTRNVVGYIRTLAKKH